MALSSLRPQYRALVFTVDVKQCLGFIISSEAHTAFGHVWQRCSCGDTHTRVCRSYGRSSLSHCRAKFCGWAKQREGRSPAPDDHIRSKFQIGASELSFFQRRCRIPRPRFTPDANPSYWGTLGRLGTHVNGRKPHEVKCSCHGTFTVSSILMTKGLLSFNPH